MADEGRQNTSLAAGTAWPLLFLTAALQAYLGLSAVAYLFMGVLVPASGPGAWTAAAMGALQAAAGAMAFTLAVRGDLRATTLAVAASVMLGWLSTVPAFFEQGLDFHGDDKVTPAIFVLAPIVAIVGGVLAWRNLFPIAAALIVTAITFLGILIVVVFGLLIALYGF